MKNTLSREHRRSLEATVARAREAAESGAAKALAALGVGASAAPGHLTPAQAALRVALRAHGRQIGDKALPDAASSSKAQSVDHLVVEVAYEHWHRMLFARFLAESDLLLHPDGYPVSLADCKEDAPSLTPPARSEWEVAGRYASIMLPQVFRAVSPALALELPLESQQALEALLASLAPEVFAADDSLGWSYQFWQAPRKEAVQREMRQSGTKVGADELPAVTQLFTEPYMVAFLLENALGAWWQSRHPGKPLPVVMPYLRTLPDGTPAAGGFAAWPDNLAGFKLLDPCLGSGHFLVAVLHYLVPLRMAVEGLSAKEAVDRVLRDNLHGLELDPRCVEIAAFALALAAWRYPADGRAGGQPLGYRSLPKLNIACCGVAPQGKRADWLALAGGDARLEDGMGQLYDLFQKAPELGSLIDPGAVAKGGLFDARWDELAGLLESALGGSAGDGEAAAQNREAVIAAQGMATATRLLSARYHLVVTNPPYLGSGQHGPILKDFCEANYSSAKGDLANVFLERSLKLLKPEGTLSFVMPQNWLYQSSYKEFRTKLLKECCIRLVARLGSGAFETIGGEVVKVALCSIQNVYPNDASSILDIDVASVSLASEKAMQLRSHNIITSVQSTHLDSPGIRILATAMGNQATLANIATALHGQAVGDNTAFNRCFWEVVKIGGAWELYQQPPATTSAFTGRDGIVLWEKEQGAMAGLAESVKHLNHKAQQWRSGKPNWGKKGVGVNLVGNIYATLYTGEIYAQSCCVIVPRDERDVAAIWNFASSGELALRLREIDPGVAVTVRTVLAVPFDRDEWLSSVSDEASYGKPYSDDPTQWIFHGHPKPATDPLQVAVARLLGYRWPPETDAAMELSSEARAWVARCQDLHSLADDDGILCLPAVRGEAAAVDRLRAMLSRAFGADWTGAREAKCLKDAGCDGLPLAQWLRDKFFEQHVARFQKRPFIWHVWCGHKDGFAALLNVHTLTRAKLQTLIHTYLGDWITQQRRAIEAGGAQAGEATLKLAKAEVLKTQLEAILHGEKPFDIFVRWKPLHQQPLGWEPDLNDGVRMNIRPWVQAGVLRINAAKLGIKWTPDRGKDVPTAPWYKLGPTYGEPEGTRINDHHLSLAEKQAERARVSIKK